MFKIFSSFRARLVLIITLIPVVTSVSSLVIFYYTTKNYLFQDLREKIIAYTQISSELIDSSDFQQLRDLLTQEPDKAFTENIENSPLYLKICSNLNKIRDAQSNIIIYAYTLVQTSESNKAWFVVDADVLKLKKDNPNDENIAHFNTFIRSQRFPEYAGGFSGRRWSGRRVYLR